MASCSQRATGSTPATPATSSKCKEVLEARIPSAVQSKNDNFLVKATLEIPIFFDGSEPSLFEEHNIEFFTGVKRNN